ncbi:hypothetical protein [Paenibacillus riograndensis]|nr:hypothetical protein [Paenibacillus riograndensis]
MIRIKSGNRIGGIKGIFTFDCGDSCGRGRFKGIFTFDCGDS